MQLIDIDKIIWELKWELKLFEKSWFFTKECQKDKKPIFTRFISYADLDKYMFNKLLIDWKNVTIEWVDNTKDLKWVYETENAEMKEIKQKFIEKISSKILFCPFCWKVPLIHFNSVLTQEKTLLEKLWIKKYNSTKSRTFDLDHIFPKSKDSRHKKWIVYPHLAINFYNLIPCCKWCNFLKSNKNFLSSLEESWKIFHPYFGFINNSWCLWTSLDEELSFSINDTKWRKKILDSQHSNFFHLKEIYLNSQDTKNDISFIRESKEKILASKQIHLNKSKNHQELKDYFFKNYAPQSENEILKFSNGKFKKDLIDNLKLEQ